MVQDTVPNLYLRFRRKVEIRMGDQIRLGDIAELITESKYEKLVSNLLIYESRVEDGNRILIDMMRIMEKLYEAAPELRVVHFGEPHVLLEVSTYRKKKTSKLLVAAVWLLLFVGSGLTIMNFHADVSMLQVHQRIYELLTGERVAHPLILQIPYSLGIGIGMVLFFNHLFKKKFNEEPSPLDVEMFTYQENLDQYVITEEYRKKQAGKKRHE